MSYQKFLIQQLLNQSQKGHINMKCNLAKNAQKNILLGYYPLRGKCQVCRLLCEYIGLAYQDVFFTPQCWQQFKATQTSDWIFAQLPFLMDKDFVTTDTYSMCFYITKKAGREQLMGKSVNDQAKVDMFFNQMDIVSLLLSKYISLKDETQQGRAKIVGGYYQEIIIPKLLKSQKQSLNQYFLGYISIIDFFIYEIMYFINIMSPESAASLPKFSKIYKNMASLPQIKAYENLEKCVKNICPLAFCSAWKQKCNPNNCV